MRKVRKWGGFPPLGCQISISNRILTFQILKEIASLIRLSGFLTLFKVFGFPSCHLFRHYKDTKFF